MKVYCSSHHYGDQAISSELSSPIIEMLTNLSFEVKKGTGKKLRKIISDALVKLGWSDKIRVDSENNITITSMKGNIGLCLQTGNVSRFYADILKLQSLYIKDKADAAIYIIPMKSASKKIGSNHAYFERLVEELNLYKHIITLPMLVIGLE
ncbi:BglII/BstYI family type II restriction endonuclease [Paenibacillus zanthoxyli]|uniref:BglII/BstYI family type II restriction endonuclease n=1 Tax=Paenibacillus zanthoxyli TaxID=369399 RepID=UPI00046EF11F|nr:BglII/BstYI family type II restriction endonuclease [Paenibacillus zanthoxyli]